MENIVQPIYSFDITDMPQQLTYEAAVEKLPQPLKVQEKLDKEFKEPTNPKTKGQAKPLTKQKPTDKPVFISGIPWQDDPNIHLLKRYFGLPDLSNANAKRLEAIINYSVGKGAASQRDLLKTITAIERQSPKGDKDDRLSLVYRYILLEGE